MSKESDETPPLDERRDDASRDDTALRGTERDTSDDQIDSMLTRRRLLAGIASVGVLGSLTSAGTQMALSDRGVFEESSLESGAIELGIAWEETYNGETLEGSDPCGDDTFRNAENEVPVVELDAIEPGDVGSLTVCLWSSAVTSVWARLLVGTTPENGVTTTEEEAGDDSESVGELQEELVVTATNTTCERAQKTLVEGTLATVNDGPLGEGIELSGDETHCLVLDWELPEDVPATILTDAVTFTLDFIAVQSRHTDSTNPWANS